MTKKNIRYFGYARVSTKEQNLDRQIAAITDYYKNQGVEIDIERDIFKDEKSGKDFDRVDYILLKRSVREGDWVTIKELDRLGRNKAEIKKELEWFAEKGIVVRILDIPTTLMDFTEYKGMAKAMMDMINNVLIEVLGTIAEEERNKIRTRQAEGIAEAKKKGKHLGRPIVVYPPMWEMYFAQWKDGDITAKEFMNNVSLKRTTFYKLVKQYKENNDLYLKERE